MSNCGTCASFVPEKEMCLFWKQTIPYRSEQGNYESPRKTRVAYAKANASDDACTYWMNKEYRDQEVQ